MLQHPYLGPTQSCISLTPIKGTCRNTYLHPGKLTKQQDELYMTFVVSDVYSIVGTGNKNN